MKKKPSGKAVIFDQGRIRYSSHTERRFFFVLTHAMLLFGMLHKLGLL